MFSDGIASGLTGGTTSGIAGGFDLRGQLGAHVGHRPVIGCHIPVIRAPHTWVDTTNGIAEAGSLGGGLSVGDGACCGGRVGGY